MWEGGPGSDAHGRLVDYGNHTARQIERGALVEGKGRDSTHRSAGRKRRFRRFIYRLRHRNAPYRCHCPAPPQAGERHTLACEMRNEGFDVPSES